MKKELLRLHNISVNYSTTMSLKRVSLFALAGECIVLLGLENSGNVLLMQVLNAEVGAEVGNIYINGKEVLEKKKIQKAVYKITDTNYIIEDWTVAEYIGLVTNQTPLAIFGTKQLEQTVAKQLKELEIKIDAREKMKHLSELEKRLVDLGKACFQDKKILLIEDEFEGCTKEEIQQFKIVLSHTIKSRMTVIINTHSEVVAEILSDSYIIFRKGNIVKKCYKKHIASQKELMPFLLGNVENSKKQEQNKDKEVQKKNGDFVYSIEKIMGIRHMKHYNFQFIEGEIVSILALNRREKEYIFHILSGRTIERGTEIKLDCKIHQFTDITDFVRNKIVSITCIGSAEKLLSSMSVGENLLMPSLRKMSTIEYVVSEHKLIKMLEREVEQNTLDSKCEVEDMSTNDHMALLLERWYIYRPKVLVLLEPFAQCDTHGVMLVKSYMKRFAKIGTTVIVIKSREEYIERISDRIITI